MEGYRTESTGLVRELSSPIYQSKGWLQFLGVISILAGILYAVTLFGILIAWLPIWIGILLFQSASAIDRAHSTGDRAALTQSLSKLKTYFVIQGVLTLILMVITLIALVVGVFAGLSGFLGGMR